MRTPLLLAAALLAGCPTEPAVPEPEPPTPGDWLDPVEVLDDWDGPQFSELMDLEVDGELLAFCTAVQGLQLYDISDPADLEFLAAAEFSDGSSAYPRCQHLSFDGQRRIVVTNRGDSIQRDSFLAVLDASTPDAPVELSSMEVDWSPEGSTIVGETLFVSGHDAGLVVLDIAADGSLSETTRVPLENAWQVRVQDDWAYVANGNAGLAVVDVTNPPAASAVALLDLPGPAKDLEVDGDRLYVALGAAGIATVDISDPAAPVLLDTDDTPGSALGVALGDALYVADWNELRVFDVTNRDDPRLVAKEPLPLETESGSRTLGIAAAGDVLFSGNWTEMVSYRYFADRTAPDITVEPIFAQLPEAVAGSTSSSVITITNEGSEPLVFTGLDVRDDKLEWDGPVRDDVLAPGASVNAVLRYHAENAASFAGELVIETDDPDQPQIVVTAEANTGGITVGSEFPGATWVDWQGDTVSFSEHAGEVVLLSYFATF